MIKIKIVDLYHQPVANLILRDKCASIVILDLSLMIQETAFRVQIRLSILDVSNFRMENAQNAQLDIILTVIVYAE